MSKPRHTRQVRLAEIGDEGQARIVATTAVVDGDGLAGTIEARYLAGAGVGKIATANQSIAEAARAVDSTVQIVSPSPSRLGLGAVPPFGVRDPTALEVATGAWRALAHIRRAVRAVSATDGEA
ncbi:MAG: hypothetical protein ACLQVI_11470 [Polyangiaceae bacterium]